MAKCPPGFMYNGGKCYAVGGNVNSGDFATKSYLCVWGGTPT